MVLVKKTAQSQKHPEQVALVVRLIERVAACLGYDETWRWRVTFKRIGDSTAGNCEVQWEYRLVEMEFDLDHIEAQKASLKETVIHEVLHVPLWQVHELVDQLYSLMPKEGAEALHEALRKTEESAVTFLEHAPLWAELLPEDQWQSSGQ